MTNTTGTAGGRRATVHREPNVAGATALVRTDARGLELDGLTKRFGQIVALDGLSLEARPGRVLGFLGPNGAGKTTAMRCVFGLVVPDTGAVRWEGRTVGPQEWRQFGYMPEERGLYPQMRVREQLDYLARLSGLDGRQAATSVARWLERLGLAERADDQVAALSHGNQQRVQLAAALVHDPELLVLDEPFAGLDPLGVEALAAVIAELAQAGAAVVFSSHQLDLVQDVCEDVVVIEHGRTVLAGSLEASRAASRRRYVEVAFRDGVTWAPQITGGRVLAADPGRTRLEVDASVDPEHLVTLARRGGELTRFSFEPPALSDLFREAVEG
ncbi:MAG TPA: ATP-binding cassette domain-containing protein [Gaiellaceae bacterium]|jgi:ABC-2 type transport system ATP-binding protein|nr:ATP-binding cassette domain-containing protein [Gaiellaceae bacterium]